MCWKNFMIWKKKPKVSVTNKSLNYIKQCYFIVDSVEKIQKEKI